MQSDGRGWARNAVNRLCIDLGGHISEPCTRDKVKESYLTPTEHPVTVRLAGAVPVGAVCAWSFDDGDGPRATTQDCAEPIDFRARYGRATNATVDVTSGSDAPQRLMTQIKVRDILVAGLGDSIASGEGNPDRTVALSDEGFCFRSYLGGAADEFYRPSRAGYNGGRACGTSGSLQTWQQYGALWMNAACHRSLYSYQARTALALAVRYTHVAVTYLPLACTGASIPDGMLGSQHARECLTSKSSAKCQGTVNGQIAQLREALAAARHRQPDRRLDLVLMTIGANDINFSGLVSDVIVDAATERALFKRSGLIGSVDNSRSSLVRDLPQILRPAARRVEATVEQRPVAGGVRLLCQSGAGERRRALHRRQGGLRRASVVQCRSRAARRGHRLRSKRIPAAAESPRAVPVRRNLPRSRRRPHDLRRGASGGFCRSRVLRARRQRS